MKLSSACIWKKRGYLWKKEAWSCLCSSDAGRGRVMATLVALGRLCLCCTSQTARTSSSTTRRRQMPPLTALPHFLVTVCTVALKCGNEMESRKSVSQIYRKPLSYEMWEAQTLNSLLCTT